MKSVTLIIPTLNDEKIIEKKIYKLVKELKKKK